MGNIKLEKLDGPLRARKSYLIRNKGLTEEQALACIQFELEILQTAGQEQQSTVVETSSNSMSNDSLAWCIQLVKVSFPACIVVAATTILVRTSVEMFGHTFEGYCKAILLELGLLGLTAYRSRNGFEWWITKAGALALVCLSIFCLHTSVKLAESERISDTLSTSSTVTGFETLANTMQADIAKLPDRNASLRDRTRFFDSARSLLNDVKDVRVSMESSHAVLAVKQATDTLFCVQLAVLFLSIFFTHVLVGQMEGLLFSKAEC